MADLILSNSATTLDSASESAVHTEAPSGAGQDRDLIELLFFAYRDFVRDADDRLAGDGFGRAHHRVLHFVNRVPGLKVADLLAILKITKQSLGRVLRDLVQQEFVEIREGEADRRHRLLYATGSGARLAEELAGLQLRRIEAALAGAGPGAGAAAARFLFGMIDADERTLVADLLARSADRAR